MTASIWTPGSNNVPVANPNSQIAREDFTATAGQTDFTLTAFTYALNSNALAVFVNGVKQSADIITELSTSSFRIVGGVELNDYVEVIGNTEAVDAEGAAVAAAASAAAALASQTAAATSETNAATSETNAATSASNAATSATNAANSATAIGNVNGIVKGNGAGTFSAAVAGTDYATGAQGAKADSALQPADIGATVQGYDVDTAKTDVAQSWTANQTPKGAVASVSTTSSFTFTGDAQVKEITLTNAITVTFGAPSGITENCYYTFKLKAGDTSARTFAWNTAYKFPAATAPLTSGTTTNGSKDIITFVGGPSNTLEYVGHSADTR